MKPPLNASEKTKTIGAGSLKNPRNIQKPNWSLVTEVRSQAKNQLQFRETKKAKRVHSDISNLTDKLLSSETTLGKSTYQHKKIKSDQLFNQTFSHKNI